MQRPTSVTVFGVLNIIFGCLGIMGTAYSAIIVAMSSARGGELFNPLLAHPLWGMWARISILLGVVSVILLITSGIGLLRMRSWGRSLAVGYAIYALLCGLVSTVLPIVILLQPEFTDSLGRGPEAAGAVAGLIGTSVGGCIGLIYPALLWFFLTRPRVVVAFGAVGSDSPWSPAASVPWTPAESKNPYATPPAAVEPVVLTGGAPGGAAESIVETFIPSRNGPALAAYYLGIFSLFPCLGFPMGVAAVYFGVAGLRRERMDPSVRGGAHAWVGVICGAVFGLFNFLLLAVAILAIIGSALGR